MAFPLFLLSAITMLAYLIVTSESTLSATQTATETSLEYPNNHRLALELAQAKLRIARLEYVFDETVQQLNSKSLSLKECEKLIGDMIHEMDRLQSALSSLKGESSCANERLNQLEEEVRLLWANLRKTNFELHFLESKAQDAENNMNLATSRVETMAAIVTEQWIQIRQLEQALHNAEVMASMVKRLPARCKFLEESILGSYACQALHQLEKISSAAKKYHHEHTCFLLDTLNKSVSSNVFTVAGSLTITDSIEFAAIELKSLNKLQGFIKQEMEKNVFTAALANKEVVFFVASALITFPVMTAWMLLCSQFRGLP